jgi:predicted nucleic acid-binding protein
VTAYPDTSFLVSLYTLDANSEAAAKKMRQPMSALFLSDLTELELTNAFEQRIFRKELKAAQVQAASRFFRADLQHGIYGSKPVGTGAVYERALKLSRKWTSSMGVRTLDILHVAIALEMKVNAILTFDRLQAKLAEAEGLKLL